MLDERRWELLACPACHGALRREPSAARCSVCGTAYPMDGHQIDLDLREAMSVDLPTLVRPFGDTDPRYLRQPSPIPRNPTGVIDVDPHQIDGWLWYGNGLTRELASWMPAGTDEDTVLDLGCGTRRFERLLAMTGMSYLSLDVAGDEPDLLGTAEALPLADDSVDFVFALAVLPHVRHPGLACREVRRVLKPGALFIGTSQFLEPCDMQSRHHGSLLGVLDWLEEGGLEILELEANAEWSGPAACAEMGYYPRRFGIGRAAGRVMTAGHRLFRLVKPAREPALLGEALPERFAGGFRFVVRNPD